MAVVQEERLPDFDLGVNYWANTDASVDGVLGGFGHGTPVPRLDATSSRLIILSLLPAVSKISPPHASSSRQASSQASSQPRRAFRALDCGAGIGRVTSTVLLPLFDRIDLVEPVPKFVEQAKRNAENGTEEGWKLLKKGKGVRMWRAGLQHFDPAAPAVALGDRTSELVCTVGNDALSWPDPARPHSSEDGYDLVMIQWCIGHLSDAELVDFLKRSRKSLREGPKGCEGYIILKENTCKDSEGDDLGRIFDEDDSSTTRSDKVFRRIFSEAGLTLIRRERQLGFPKELFPVISYVLR